MRLQTIAGWMPRARRRRAIVLGLLISVSLGIGATAIVACSGGDGSSPDRSTSTAAPTATRTSRPTTVAKTTTPNATPTVVLPPGGEPPAGGDRPVGPAPAARAGNIPENAGVSADFMALHDTLQREIDAYRASTGTEVAIAVTDLQTNQSISVRGNVAQRTGCTIHLFALLAITSEFQAGRGNPATVADSVKIGIGASYPPQVRAFLDAVFGDFHRGEQRGRDLMASWGMSASLFDHVAYYGDGTQNNLLTALETNATLTKLYRGQLFDGQWTSYALGRLHDIKYGLNYIIPGQLPAQASVAHKIGYYADADGWVVADAGLVTFAGRDGQQRAYAVTYLSEKAPTEYAGYSFGARLSRIVWDWIYPRYQIGVPPTAVPPRPPTPRPTHRPENTPRPTRTPTRVPTSTSVPSATATP
ncbi:MAG: serine hydrolase [Dehalococcoidia bacterium]